MSGKRSGSDSAGRSSKEEGLVPKEKRNSPKGILGGKRNTQDGDPDPTQNEKRKSPKVMLPGKKNSQGQEEGHSTDSTSTKKKSSSPKGILGGKKSTFLGLHEEHAQNQRLPKIVGRKSSLGGKKTSVVGRRRSSNVGGGGKKSTLGGGGKKSTIGGKKSMFVPGKIIESDNGYTIRKTSGDRDSLSLQPSPSIMISLGQTTMEMDDDDASRRVQVQLDGDGDKKSGRHGHKHHQRPHVHHHHGQGKDAEDNMYESPKTMLCETFNSYRETRRRIKELQEGNKRNDQIVLFFVAAKDSRGQVWNNDCNIAERAVSFLIKKIQAGGRLLKVLVGDRTQWMDEDNPWRKDPRYKLTEIPALMVCDTLKRLDGRQVFNMENIIALLRD